MTPGSHPAPGRVLLIGVCGMLGRAWRELLDHRGIPHVDAGRGLLDLRDPQSIDAIISGEQPVVINCAAFTDVDGAERDEATAHAVNTVAPEKMARRCGEVGALFVHYSTDYVFNGRATQPYVVAAPREPVNVYGRSKAAGEEAIEAAQVKHLIIRASWLYAPWGKNFVRTIAKLAVERPSLRVVNDQRGRPTSCEHLAAASLRLIESDATGIWHITDRGDCTWFDFAQCIAAHANPACRIEPCTTAEFPRPAKRPAYSVLDIAATEKQLGPMPHWHDNLAHVLARLEPLT